MLSLLKKNILKKDIYLYGLNLSIGVIDRNQKFSDRKWRHFTIAKTWPFVESHLQFLKGLFFIYFSHIFSYYVIYKSTYKNIIFVVPDICSCPFNIFAFGNSASVQI